MLVQTWFKRFATVTLLALVSSVLMARGGAVKASPQDTNWSPTEIRSKYPPNAAVYSAIDYDAAGKAHIAWYEYGPTDGDMSKVFYTNNVNGTWLTPFEVSNSAARGAEPLLSMVVEDSGARAHLLYVSSSNQVVHRYLTLGGPLPLKSPVTVMSNNKGANPNLTIDAFGNINALWITRTSDSAPYLVNHRIWRVANAAWEGSSRIVRPDGVLQKFPKGVATNDGRLHVVFLSSNRFRYSVFNGSTWAPSTDISPASPKQIGLATDGATLFVLYTAQPGNSHNTYFVQGSNGAWTSPVLLSSGSSYDELPDLFYSPTNNTVYNLWVSGTSPQNTKTVVREYAVGAGFGSVVNFGGFTTQYPHGAASANEVSVIWQDKTTGVYDIRHKYALLGDTPTPTPTNTPTPMPTVDFTLAVGNATTGNNVPVTLSGFSGNPDRMRVSATPFAPDAPAAGTLAWAPLDNVFGYTATPNAACQATIYVQLHNSSTGLVSAVKSGTGMVDTDIQADVVIRTRLEDATRPQAELQAPNVEQPNAPTPPDLNYSRTSTFFYDIGQEPATCSGLDKHKAGPIEFNPPSYPLEDQMGTYTGFNPGADSNGVGLIEQTLQATVRVTDTVGNAKRFARTISLDDDPPVLLAGGLLTLTHGLTSTSSLVDIYFDAEVHDDGYLDPSAPTERKYWGIWVVATNSSALPTPQVFQQFGRLVRLPAGATTATVQVTNPGLSGSGLRYVHIRFLDGAGNYTEGGLTSEQLFLEPGFTERQTFQPLIMR